MLPFLSILCILTYMRNIPGLPDYYLVSPDGLVYSQERVIERGGYRLLRQGRFLRPFNKQGYPCVTICWPGGMRRCYRVHRLVALAYLSNPKNRPQINHINGIKTDNRKENLEWCTAWHNSKHAWRTGLSRLESRHA